MEDEEEANKNEIYCYFLCPISLELMRDPVTVSTGITYDRENIEKWIFSCKKPVCPVTKQKLVNTDLTPNHTLRRVIEEWCGGMIPVKTSQIENQGAGVDEFSDEYLQKLSSDRFLQVSLIKVMENGSHQSRIHALTLLQKAFYKTHIDTIHGSDPELFKQTVRILSDRISRKAIKAALKLLHNLCSCVRNKIKAVENGAVSALIELLLESEDKRVCELIVTVLEQLCGCAEGRADLLKHGAGLAIVSKKILRVSHNVNEKAVRILHTISRHSACNSTVLKEMVQVGVVSKLCLLLQVECSHKTKEKAKEALVLNSRVWKDSKCIPPHLLSSYPS